MPDLLACDQADAQAEQIDLLSQQLAGVQRRMAFVTGLQSAFSSLLSNLGMLAVLVLAIPLVSSGELPPVYLAVVALAALTGFEAVVPAAPGCSVPGKQSPVRPAASRSGRRPAGSPGPLHSASLTAEVRPGGEGPQLPLSHSAAIGLPLRSRITF